MGHREDLLVGAKRCLIEKGYARTTARDIVAASGTNLASIGYHYGSKEALLNEALIAALQDSAEELQRAMNADAEADTENVDPLQRFEAIWTRVIEQFTTHRQLWLASMEIFAQMDHVEAVREALSEGIEQGRAGMAEVFMELTSDGSDDAGVARAAGSFYQALATGVMAQWLVDPDRAPTGRDLAIALQAIVAWADPQRRPASTTAQTS
ncbi:TetR/AcrR family transcriptional regulator [Streptomyces sp. NPDC019531]|uniref:TetR/AcrR family transcriptional regulator n=1 Tax=Streptomyces sp. NPDC019531 TaxID=3365062 RepID=UPI00384C1D83